MDSKRITATGSRLDSLLGNMVNNRVDDKGFEDLIDQKVEDSKIKTGVITKYYHYLDKAEVKLDKTGKLVLCKILHRYGGDMIDLYTPLSFKQSYCEKLKEPCIIPKARNNVCVLQIDDADSEENLILGYYQNKDIVGLKPASPGNMKLTSITEPNEFWIKFGKDGLDLRLPNRPTEQVGNVEKNMKDVQTYTKQEVDDLLSKIKSGGSEVDVSDKISFTELMELVENYKETSNEEYYLFRGDCWTINTNFESSASITSESDKDMKICGTFRTFNDMIGLYWYSKDPISHPYISYGERKDYSNVVLEFDYKMTGCRPFGFEGFADEEGHLIFAPVSITIVTNHGETYYVTMNRFIEKTGNDNGYGTEGHFKLDFENLYAQVGNHYLNSKGEDIEFKEGDNLKIPVNDIDYIMFVIVPEYFVENKIKYTIMQNVDFDVEISNIKVTGGHICNEHKKLQPHPYRLCEGYDDFYDLNPRRITREMRKLGYTEWCDLYIGASHFYEKQGTENDVINVKKWIYTDNVTGERVESNDKVEGTDGYWEDVFGHERTGKMELITSAPLNRAFREWLDCYSRELKKNDCPNLVVSVSMENLQCPPDWRQKQFAPTPETSIIKNDEGYALTGWIPSTFFYSPCHEDILPYMQSVSEACLDIVVANDMRPILQLGEAWWWWNEYADPVNRSPCFYDEKTKAKYRQEFGKELPVYQTPEDEFDGATIDWLNKQIVDYSWGIRSVVKQDKYANGLYMALFFPPSVLDTDRVPPMMRRVNYLTGIYNPMQLDVLQLEDYDWVTGSPVSPETKERDRMHHKEVYSMGQDLGFKVEELHYFGGFVQYPENAVEFWREIKKAMEDAIKLGFQEVFVWAGTQVRRDNKIIGHDKYEIVQQLLYL